ncbi:hypothetical protein A2U01_0093472, partial [Trifolium medium]|nr:hypothetical protein [Trifolium medium]
MNVNDGIVIFVLRACVDLGAFSVGMEEHGIVK